MRTQELKRQAATGGLLVVAVVGLAAQKHYTDWSQAQNLEVVNGAGSNLNTASVDGCPAISRDGLALYMASNRPGSQINPATGLPSLDIWVAEREGTSDPWGEPTPLPAPVNTPQDDFCPTPMRDGHSLLFVSARPNGCGVGDIHITRHHVNNAWTVPQNLGCVINSSAEEASPFLVDYDDRPAELYFSSTRAGGFSTDAPGATTGDSDIYVSVLQPDGLLGAPTLVPGINTADQDARPHVRRDGREILFDSTRLLSQLSPSGARSFDIWSATRQDPSDVWSLPVNLGSAVNSSANETRAFLSWDAATLFFGSTRAGFGSTDIYVSTREREHQPSR